MNYVRAMNRGLARLKELPVSVRLIREIHAELLHGVRGSHLTPGELRRSQNWIGPGGATLANATFVPPPPEDVPQALGDLETFLHQRDDVPLLIKFGLAHAQFETISYYCKAHRQEYYERLQAVRDHGDWEGWLDFFLKGIIEVSAQAADTARRILALREEHRSLIADRLGRAAGNGHRVLQHLYVRPIVRATEVQALLKTTFTGANQVVRRLVEIGVLVEITGQARHRRFRYEPYVRLFDGA